MLKLLGPTDTEKTLLPQTRDWGNCCKNGKMKSQGWNSLLPLLGNNRAHDSAV